ncbi:ABC transporter permease, partial [Actinoplanes sp. NPDC051633]
MTRRPATPLLRRIRASAGHLAMLAVLAGVAAFAVGAAPRIVNQYGDAGLRADLDRLPYTVRDVIISARTDVRVGPATDLLPADGAGQLDAYRRLLPAPLPSLIGAQWYTARVGPAGVQAGPGENSPDSFGGSCPPSVSVRTRSGAEQEVRLVEGRTPRSGTEVEATLARPAAAALGLRVGSDLTLGGRAGFVPIRVVGIVEQLDPGAPGWADSAVIQTSCPNPADGIRVQAALFTDAPGVRLAAESTQELATEWRYRLNTSRLGTADVPALSAAVAQARRSPPPGTLVTTGLETALSRYDAQQQAVAALLAVVQAGVLASLIGLLLLASGLLVAQRRTEFALLRARGAAVSGIAGRTLAETLLVVPVAVLAGGLAAGLL